MVDLTIYRCSLVAALSLMIFFSLTFLLGRVPSMPSAMRYVSARRRMGWALLILSANYAVHLFAMPRLSDIGMTIFMNISTYYIVAWLFGSSMLHLLRHDYNSPRRDRRNVASWVAFVAVSGLLYTMAPTTTWRIATLLAMSLVFMLYTLRVAISLVAAYRRAVKLLDSYYSDDVAAYVRWVSVFTWLAVFYGVLQGVFTFIPDRYVFVWILSSIPFYTYGYVSYINYSLDFERVDPVLDDQATEPEPVSEPMHGADGQGPDKPHTEPTETAPTAETALAERIEAWADAKGFVRQGLTIVQLAQELYTNRTYLSGYINSRYHMSFREWVNSLRLEHAKHLLATQPELNITDVAQRAGFISLSNFTRLFTANVGTTPGRWRRENM